MEVASLTAVLRVDTTGFMSALADADKTLSGLQKTIISTEKAAAGLGAALKTGLGDTGGGITIIGNDAATALQGITDGMKAMSESVTAGVKQLSTALGSVQGEIGDTTKALTSEGKAATDAAAAMTAAGEAEITTAKKVAAAYVAAQAEIKQAIEALAQAQAGTPEYIGLQNQLATAQQKVASIEAKAAQAQLADNKEQVAGINAVTAAVEAEAAAYQALKDAVAAQAGVLASSGYAPGTPQYQILTAQQKAERDKLAALETSYGLRAPEEKPPKQIESPFSKNAKQEIDSVAKSTRGAAGSFFDLGTAAAFASSSFLIGLFAGTALRSVVDATRNLSTAQDVLGNTVKNVGGNWQTQKKSIEEYVSKAADASGFMDTELTNSLTKTIQATGSVAKGQRALSIATDLARAKNMDLTTATKDVVLVSEGHASILRRQGIVLPTVTRAQNDLKIQLAALASQGIKVSESSKLAAIALAKQKDAAASGALGLVILANSVAGANAAYVKSSKGGIALFQLALERLKEDIGKALLPDLDRLVRYLAKVAEGWVKSGAALHAAQSGVALFKRVIETVAPIVEHLFQAVRDGVNSVGGLQNAIELLASMWAIRFAVMEHPLLALIIGVDTILHHFQALHGLIGPLTAVIGASVIALKLGMVDVLQKILVFAGILPKTGTEFEVMTEQIVAALEQVKLAVADVGASLASLGPEAEESATIVDGALGSIASEAEVATGAVGSLGAALASLGGVGLFAGLSSLAAVLASSGASPNVGEFKSGSVEDIIAKLGASGKIPTSVIVAAAKKAGLGANTPVSTLLKDPGVLSALETYALKHGLTTQAALAGAIDPMAGIFTQGPVGTPGVQQPKKFNLSSFLSSIPGRRNFTQLPPDIQVALAKAGTTTTNKDDITALTRAIDYLKIMEPALSKKGQIAAFQMQGELQNALKDITSPTNFGLTGTTKGHKGSKSGLGLLPAALSNAILNAQQAAATAGTPSAANGFDAKILAAQQALHKSAKAGLDYLNQQMRNGNLTAKMMLADHKEALVLTKQMATSLKAIHEELKFQLVEKVNKKIAKILGINQESGDATASRLRNQERNTLLSILKSAGGKAGLGAFPGAASDSIKQLEALIKHIGAPKSTLDSLRKIDQSINLASAKHVKINQENTQNITERLREIKDTLNKHKYASNYIAPYAHNLTAGLGLTREQRIAEEARLAQYFGHGKKVPTGTAAAGVPLDSSGRPVAAPGHSTVEIHFHGGVYFNGVSDVNKLRDEMLKTARRNPTQTRGPNAGRKIGLT